MRMVAMPVFIVAINTGINIGACFYYACSIKRKSRVR